MSDNISINKVLSIFCTSEDVNEVAAAIGKLVVEVTESEEAVKYIYTETGDVVVSSLYRNLRDGTDLPQHLVFKRRFHKVLRSYVHSGNMSIAELTVKLIRGDESGTDEGSSIEDTIVPYRAGVMKSKKMVKAFQDICSAAEASDVKLAVSDLMEYLASFGEGEEVFDVLFELRMALMESLAEQLYLRAARKEAATEAETLRYELYRYLSSPLDMFSAFID